MNELFKALSHPARREIISALDAGPMASGDIAAMFDMSWPTVTGHLNVLKDAGLVEAERQGSSIRYRLNMSAAEEAVSFLVGLMNTGASRPRKKPGLKRKPLA
ncbi:metalloregulator ArsR/SmtB family transcription factor [Piscinibacter terrae]|uniref:ArsR family transcriptional regulator n=1 Tax=Piscinibacter terrae TaxID=2496871 RepID=A0A3N7HLU8_9BURK|nr:metalloregulator ArsR/SmtB family transcription factor [Albitalea terrae]RQP23074.1 ArsR family transcriptional regulator [Albitalea terrae]